MTISDPAGFTVDLTNCDREPIHQLGRVQSFGFLLSTTADGHVTGVSQNIEDHIGIPPEDCLDRPLSAILTAECLDTIRDCLPYLQDPGVVERRQNQIVVDGGIAFDLSLHISGHSIVLEFEPSSAQSSANGHVNTVRSYMNRLAATRDQDRFYSDAVRFMRSLTGFDRIMLYRFLPDDCGEVIAEDRSHGMEPFLNLRYPASDIPKQARALYLKNPIRIISDSSDPGSPIVSEKAPEDAPLDLSLSTLRSVSPIHLEYLTNMGVAASMSVSVVVQGKLWGLLACHHRETVVLSQSKRLAADLFGQMFSLILEGKLAAEETADDDKVLHLINSFATTASAENLTSRLMVVLDEFVDVLAADGVGLLLDGKIILSGATPTQDELSSIADYFNREIGNSVFSTHEIGSILENGSDFVDRAAGMLAIPISRSPRDYIVFFRREVVQHVLWAGNPDKPVTVGPNGIRLTPRKSFESWQASVRGQSEPWSPANLRAAGQLRLAILEIVLRLTDEVARERKAAQEKQELLIAELNHRVRNILGLVRGIVGHSRSPDISSDEYFELVDSRLQAMARAHDQITEKNWSSASLQNLIRIEGESYLTEKATRVRISGEDCNLTPDAFSTVALVIHELMTNSMKYGGLSDHHGNVHIECEFNDNGDLVLRWTEMGGPAVRAPERKGFGSTIIERSIPFQLNGKARMDFHLSGLAATFEIPARYVSAADATKASAPSGRIPNASGNIAAPRNVLVVEDLMIIGMAAEDNFYKLGSENVSVVSNLKQAEEAIREAQFDFVLLDVNLGKETSFALAADLLRDGTSFAFATGYGDSANYPPSLRDIPLITKPYNKDSIADLLVRSGFAAGG